MLKWILLLILFFSFDFVFSLITIRTVLSVSFEFSNSLQRKDSDIYNALSLLKTTESLLSDMRDSGYSKLVEEEDISVP